MSELRRIYGDLVGFKTELWDAVQERLLSEFGLPLPYFEAMAAIDRLEACGVRDVAAELEISGGTAAELVHRIEAEGYCRQGRSCDPAVPVVELTSSGRRLVTEAGAAFDDELEHRFAAAVPVRMLDHLAAALKRLRRADVTVSS
jgi:DNA-binding MarR family transcriptional regulator